MSQQSPVMVVIPTETEREFANQLAHALGYEAADVVIGTPGEAALALAARATVPSYIVIDIGDRAFDVLPEIDAMAENCQADTRAVVVGSANDVKFYRELRQRGIIEYFTRPASISDLRTALMYDGGSSVAAGDSFVLSFMSAASGDGSSTVALNTAYCLAEEMNQSTVIIDMDYQFGMVARNLDLSSPFGIKEIFEHPDRTIDATLLERMMVPYGKNLKVISAPVDLRLLPNIRPEAIRDLLVTLRERFTYVVVDIPHIWSPWVAAALGDSTQVVMVSQLWLRSVTHASRLLSAWRDIGISEDSIFTIINRSGAKFKEGLRAKDYEKVCSIKIDYYLANDIRTVMLAENQGKTLLETGTSMLARQFREFATDLHNKFKGGGTAGAVNQTSTKHGLSSSAGKK